jgi:cytochrome b6-f complex iron-sulfur subunit
MGCEACSACRAATLENPVERRALLQLGAAGATVLLAACGSGSRAEQTNAGGSDPDGGGAPLGDEAGQGDAGCSTGSRVVTLSFSQYPQLMQVGGSITVSASGYVDPTCRRNLILVAQVSTGSFVALSASCTHQCCPVSYFRGSLVCPCHGSTFDMSGAVIGGPAQRPLQNFEVCSDESGVSVMLG